MRTAKTLIRLADAQADLSLRWVHTHFVGFVMTWLIYMSYNKGQTSILLAFSSSKPHFLKSVFTHSLILKNIVFILFGIYASQLTSFRIAL